MGESYAADLDLCVFVRMGSALTADGPAAQHNTWTSFSGVVKTGRELDTTGGLLSLTEKKGNTNKQTQQNLPSTILKLKVHELTLEPAT